MFSRTSQPHKFQPMTTEEIAAYIQRTLHPLSQRLPFLVAGLARNRAVLMEQPMTAESMFEGLFGACPYVQPTGVIPELRAVLINLWGWRCDDQDRWSPRT